MRQELKIVLPDIHAQIIALYCMTIGLVGIFLEPSRFGLLNDLVYGVSAPINGGLLAGILPENSQAN